MYLPKEVTIGQLTEDSIDYLWEHLKRFDVLFSDDSRWDKASFLDRLAAEGLVFLNIDNGVLFLENIVLGQFTQIHACLWDGRLSQRTEVLKHCLTWAFDTYRLERIEAIIPAFCQSLRRYLKKRLGFTEEGVLRKRLLYKNTMVDVIVLAILKEEHNGHTNIGK